MGEKNIFGPQGILEHNPEKNPQKYNLVEVFGGSPSPGFRNFEMRYGGYDMNIFVRESDGVVMWDFTGAESLLGSIDGPIGAKDISSDELASKISVVLEEYFKKVIDQAKS